MTVMVTGVGFIGGHVVKELLEAGEDVVMYGQLGAAGETDDVAALPDVQYVHELSAGAAHPGTTTAVLGDIRDYDRILQTIQDHSVGKIVHLASLVSQASEADVPRAIDVNVKGTVNVFGAAVEAGVGRVVWASSINVFGPKSFAGREVIDDDSPADPSTVYGFSKAFLEGIAAAYHRNHGLNVVGLRPARVYGYGEQLKAARGGGTKFVDNLLRIPATGSEPAVVPFGNQVMDFQYVGDIAAAFAQALATDAGGGQSFVTSGDRRPISDAFEYVQSLIPDADIRLATPADGFELPAGAQTSWAYPFDASRAKRVLGIRSRFTMEEGFFRTLSAYRESAGLPPLTIPDHDGGN